MEEITLNDKLFITTNYLKWNGGVTELNVPTRVVREQKIRVTIKNLLDYLLYRAVKENEEQIIMSKETFEDLIKIDTDLNTYKQLKEIEEPKLYKRSRIKPQFVLDTLKELTSKDVIEVKTKRYVSFTHLFEVISYDSDLDYLIFRINKNFIDFISPKDNYKTKYLVDGMVLSSVYSKNLHSFVSYFCDVFKSGKFINGKEYRMTTFDQIEQYVGIRYNKVANKYDKETGSYPKSKVVDILRGCVSEINEKTRLPEGLGELDFEVIYGKHNGKAVSLGVRFFFKEVQ